MKCKPAVSGEVAFSRKEYCESPKKQSSLSLKFKRLDVKQTYDAQIYQFWNIKVRNMRSRR